MPGTEHPFAHPTKLVTRKLAQNVDNEEEPAEQAFETNSWQTTPVMNQKLTRSNILTMQRTIGNQAVTRLIKSNQNPKATSGSSNTPKPIVQRKIGDKGIIKKLTSTLTKSSFDDVYDAYKDYDDAGTSKEFYFLLKLKEVAYNWLHNHHSTEGTNGKRGALVKGLLKEIEVELPKILPKQVLVLSVKTGLPDSYLQELLQDTTNKPLMLIAQADAYLEMGEPAKAETCLIPLKGILPKTYPLVKSAILRTNLGSFNPEMAKMMGNENYRQEDEKSARRGNDVYDQGRMNSDAGAQQFAMGYTAAGLLGGAGEKASLEKEKGFAQVESIKGLSTIDISSISQYSMKNYKDINNSLRNMPLTGAIQTGGPATEEGFTSDERKANRKKHKGQFTDAKMNYTQNTISALNKIPPYKGKVYRHDRLFAGFEEVFREGATVSDMAFLSTTYNPVSLNSMFGTDILSIIDSKTGRFIKPISSSPKEDEVLFKPGTRFTIKKVYKANLNSTDLATRWTNLPGDVKGVLDADSSGPLIKYIVVREEV